MAPSSSSSSSTSSLPKPSSLVEQHQQQCTTARSINTSSMSEHAASCILGGTRRAFPHDDARTLIGIPTYPRRIWNLSDTNIPRRSSLWPRPVVYTRLCDTTTAAVVGIRIAECLRVRSVSAEYDEETFTATCCTVDACRFTIHVWQGLVVECVRVRGHTITFHSTAQSILNAAQGLESGQELRHVEQVSPLEYPRLVHMQEQQQTWAQEKTPLKKGSARPTTACMTAAMEGLERVNDLLGKDRFECRKLGMESLVCYTDSCSVSMAHETATLLVSAFDNNNCTLLRALLEKVLHYATIPLDTTLDEETLLHQDHGLRTLALHVLANLKALTGHSLLPPESLDFLIAGATRPASSTKVPGPHDAALACAAATTTTAEGVQQLEQCILAGRATHTVLWEQARRLYDKSTQAQREC